MRHGAVSGSLGGVVETRRGGLEARHSRPETEPEPEPEPASELDSAPELELEPATKTVSKIESKPEPELESESKFSMTREVITIKLRH